MQGALTLQQIRAVQEIHLIPLQSTRTLFNSCSRFTLLELFRGEGVRGSVLHRLGRPLSLSWGESNRERKTPNSLNSRRLDFIKLRRLDIVAHGKVLQYRRFITGTPTGKGEGPVYILLDIQFRTRHIENSVNLAVMRIPPRQVLPMSLH